MRAARWVGAQAADVKAANPGEKGEKAFDAIMKFEAKAEEKYGEKLDYFKIQGTKLHTSSKDPEEAKQVITVSAHTKTETRLAWTHAGGDGTYTEIETRSGKT